MRDREIKGQRTEGLGARDEGLGSQSLIPNPQSLTASPHFIPLSLYPFIPVTLLLMAGLALAQPQSQSPVFKYYVWGQVRNPGAYGLSGNPDLVELLSAAGGPTQYADVTHVILVRAVTQQRMRVNLKRVLGKAQVVLLSPGDVVMVPDSPWARIRDGMGIVTTIVSFATLVLVVANGVGR